jgi:hypothetical protein
MGDYSQRALKADPTPRKWWTAEDLPKGAIAYSAPYGATPGDLYAVFPDGTYQLLEKGHGARVEAEAKAANEKLYGAGGHVNVSDPKPAIAPTPPSATSSPAANKPAQVKTASIDTVLFNDDEVSPELMEKLIFENIGGHELINIARNDIINGQDISYQPIKNLSSLQQQYNPNNILGLQSTSDKYFANFAIKLENKSTNVANGPFGANVYIDPLTGDLVIDAVNIEVDEQIEIEITLSGTIYEADLTGSES